MSCYTDVSSQDFSYEVVYCRNKQFFQPLGKISRSQLRKAEQILDSIKSEIENGYLKNRRHLIELTNQFHTLVPSPETSRTPNNLQVIDNEEILVEKYTLIRALKSN